MQANQKDLGAGLLFTSIGLFFTLGAVFGLPIGTASSMGAGYFPLWLGILLTCFGLGIFIKGFRTAPEGVGTVPWRGAGLLLGAVLFFALAVDRLGFLPAMAGCCFLAAISPNDATWKSAVAITVALTAFCVFVFIYALGLPYPMIGPWLGGR